MITVSLKTFAETGYFGPVTVGMTKDELIAHLGEPSGIQDFGETLDVHYSWYEFFCWADNGKILGIQNDHLRLGHFKRRSWLIENHRHDICFENDTFRIDTWFMQLGKDMFYYQVLELLRAEGIAHEEVFVDNSGWRIVFPSGVFIDFAYEAYCKLQDDPPIDKAHLVVNGMRIFNWDV